jgi:hypothetical protein
MPTVDDEIHEGIAHIKPSKTPGRCNLCNLNPSMSTESTSAELRRTLILVVYVREQGINIGLCYI